MEGTSLHPEIRPPAGTTAQSEPDSREGQEELYENAGFIMRNRDPFGTEFEEAIRCGSRVRVKWTSVSSGERVSESDPEPGNVTGEKDMVSRVEDTPPLPWKKCYRSTSQISRISSQSGSSTHTRQSYDEVGLSTNFNKPVIAPQPENSPRVDDIFQMVSFDSPLHDIGRNGEPAVFRERNLDSIDSNNSSVSPAGPAKNLSRQFSVEVGEDPYEDIEMIRENLDRQERVAPEPPPRNSILRPETVYETLEKDVDKAERGRLAEENIYSDCDTSGDSGKEPDNKNLMDRLMEEDSAKDLGAIPKTGSARMTIDIRSKVSKWYEDAEKEVERDLSLDISQLEMRNSPKPKVRTKLKPAYEHISVAITGKPVLAGEEIFPKPTMTLLRDFDPCFDEVDDTDDDIIDNIVSADRVEDTANSKRSPKKVPPIPFPGRNSQLAVLKRSILGLLN